MTASFGLEEPLLSSSSTKRKKKEATLLIPRTVKVSRSAMGPFYSKPVGKPLLEQQPATSLVSAEYDDIDDEPEALVSSSSSSTKRRLEEADDDDDEPRSTGPRSSPSPSKRPRNQGWFAMIGLAKKVTPTSSSASSDNDEVVCDRCDGKHRTADCPHFTKERDDHPDALQRTPRCANMGLDGGNAYLKIADVVHQPGDGSCLFHALGDGYARLSSSGPSSSGGGPPFHWQQRPSALALRGKLMDWLLNHEDERIADTPVKDWVKWDSGCSVAAYAKRMRFHGWGGGIEMAAFAHLFDVEVHVYEKQSPSSSSKTTTTTTTTTTPAYKRISRFAKNPQRQQQQQQQQQPHLTKEQPEKPAVVNVLYCGGVHYDSLVARSPLTFVVEKPQLNQHLHNTKKKVVDDDHLPARSPVMKTPLYRPTTSKHFDAKTPATKLAHKHQFGYRDNGGTTTTQWNTAGRMVYGPFRSSNGHFRNNYQSSYQARW